MLGLLGEQALNADPVSTVELSMEPGPTTVRPDRALADVRKDLRQHGAEHVVVTTAEGQLIGIAERRDIEHRLSPSGQSQKV